MDHDSQEFKHRLKILKAIDFELAYLALLTCEGLKPLSRWEKPLDGQQFSLLQGLGLLTKQIRRTVKTGKEVVEAIFSLLPSYIELYERRFANTPIDKSAETQRFEGFLFGYPACCVNQYIRKPYAPNSMAAEDRKILFHWACKDCKITPVLLPAYRRIHSQLKP